eukprot:TRINITY_DN13115_c0_g2_i2.p2 TRINITY_DN13115_c0_g2~~TRINITY_DN13115_c0_g2_i2.p2  ORF type:complete len:241 (+),score=73.14 TRINITY_DN13115_c0_g2_i2:361-1083(+)
MADHADKVEKGPSEPCPPPPPPPSGTHPAVAAPQPPSGPTASQTQASASARRMLQGFAAAGFCKITGGSDHSTATAQSPVCRHGTAFAAPQPPAGSRSSQTLVPGRGGGYHRPPRAPRQQVPAPKLMLQPPGFSRVRFGLLDAPIKGRQGAAAARERKGIQNRIRQAEKDQWQHRGDAALASLYRDRAAAHELRTKLELGTAGGVSSAATLGKSVEEIDAMVDQQRWRLQRESKQPRHWL